MTKLRICLVSAEVAPFAKTGGLADMVAGLARFLARRGHDVRVFTPRYLAAGPSDAELRPHPRLQDVPVRFGARTLHFSVSRAPLPGGGPAVHFVRCPELYGRPALYTQDRDEHLRFALLSRAAIEGCQRMQWGPDVFHCHDWHAALLPLWLKTAYAWDRLFAATRSVVTVHNLGYQGVFGRAVLDDLDLASQAHLLPREDLDEGRVSFLRIGLVFADALTTVSKTYAQEIQTPELGMGLDGVLRARRDVLVGIVNGVDYGDWDPATDPLITRRYDAADPSGKAENKRALQRDFELAPEPRTPLAGIVSRLVVQKGFELLPEVLLPLVARGELQLAVLGSGEERYEDWFQRLRDQHPRAVAFYRGYNNALAHRIEAASDLFLMPSRYEPCGLNQMYSLRYGSVPVVRRTGGLADTVEPFDRASGRGTGFLFDEFSPSGLRGALRAALELWPDEGAWRRLVRNGMAQDFSWDRQGSHYAALYGALRASAATGAAGRE